ncbi:MAG: hypothetical protein DBX38_06335 [Eubacteriales Family XIII. Incertae Sedis bacterium]|nr:MAG: hypothetical protein DBX38_06335 [Clostridiales Family XIII bacterium]
MDIKKLPGSERPREKLLRLGAGALSDRELLAILLGTGTRELPVLELAEKLLDSDRNGILFLADCVPEELCSISGIGYAKACSIAASIELGKRIAKRPKDGRYIIAYAEQAANLIMEDMRHLKREVFLVILLSSKGEVISFEKVAEGDINTAAVKAREIFQAAVRRNAFSVILAHNHPSGDPEPSRADIETTSRLIEAGELLGIYVADHIIIGNNRYYSFKENKIMQ